MSLKLYDLATAYDLLLKEDGDSNERTFAEALSQLQGQIAEKTDGLVKVVRTLEAEERAIEEEIARLRAKRDSRTDRIVWLKDYLLRNLLAADLNRVQGNIFTVTLQNSPPACRIDDAAAVPLDYQTVIPATMKVDARSIIERWKTTGEQVPGATVTQGKHVRIT